MRFSKCYGKLILYISNNYSFVEILKNLYYHAESKQYMAYCCTVNLPIYLEILTPLGYCWFGLILLPEIQRLNFAWQSVDY